MGLILGLTSFSFVTWVLCFPIVGLGHMWCHWYHGCILWIVIILLFINVTWLLSYSGYCIAVGLYE